MDSELSPNFALSDILSHLLLALILLASILPRILITLFLVSALLLHLDASSLAMLGELEGEDLDNSNLSLPGFILKVSTEISRLRS